MSNKSDLLKNFGWLTLGFAVGFEVTASFNGKSLIDLAIKKYNAEPLPCVETAGEKLEAPFDELACK